MKECANAEARALCTCSNIKQWQATITVQWHTSQRSVHWITTTQKAILAPMVRNQYKQAHNGKQLLQTNMPSTHMKRAKQSKAAMSYCHLRLRAARKRKRKEKPHVETEQDQEDIASRFCLLHWVQAYAYQSLLVKEPRCQTNLVSQYKNSLMLHQSP